MRWQCAAIPTQSTSIRRQTQRWRRLQWRLRCSLNTLLGSCNRCRQAAAAVAPSTYHVVAQRQCCARKQQQMTNGMACGCSSCCGYRCHRPTRGRRRQSRPAWPYRIRRRAVELARRAVAASVAAPCHHQSCQRGAEMPRRRVDPYPGNRRIPRRKAAERARAACRGQSTGTPRYSGQWKSCRSLLGSDHLEVSAAQGSSGHKGRTSETSGWRTPWSTQRRSCYRAPRTGRRMRVHRV